jgi:hypothetical protein
VYNRDSPTQAKEAMMAITVPQPSEIQNTEFQDEEILSQLLRHWLALRRKGR